METSVIPYTGSEDLFALWEFKMDGTAVVFFPSLYHFYLSREDICCFFFHYTLHVFSENRSSDLIVTPLLNAKGVKHRHAEPPLLFAERRRYF